MDFLNYHGKETEQKSEHFAGDSNKLVPISLLRYVIHYLYGVNEQNILKPGLKMFDKYEQSTDEKEKEKIRKIIVAMGESSIGKKLPSGIVLSRNAAKNVADFVYYVEGARGARLAVGPCICQLAVGRTPTGSPEPEIKDITLMYGADIYLDLGLGFKEINNIEANEILEDMHEKGYVHQIIYMFNEKEGSFVMCNCDGDGICAVVRGAKLFGTNGAPGPEICEREENNCKGVKECGKCIKRCPFGANIADGEKVVFDKSKCFGCELCVTTCEGKCRTMAERADYGYENIMSKRLLLAGKYGYDKLVPYIAEENE